MDRKNFLQTISLGSIPFLVPSGLQSKLSASINQPSIKERRDVSLLTANDSIIKSYKKAVEKMKALPSGDPRNWTRQAEIHQNFCPHNNWFFLPWHRAYLYYFEDICKEMSEDDNFRLPYWDWTSSPQIPSTFWGADNPLYDSSRRVQPGTTASIQEIGLATIDRILNVRSFENFASGKSTCGSFGGGITGQLEGGPHNYIHAGYVRGNMGTMMSPLDPVFWLHHANCDRLWNVWLAKGNANTTDPDWLNCSFQNQFYDRKGNQVKSRPISGLLNTASLGYRYQGQLQTAGSTALKSSFGKINQALSLQAVVPDQKIKLGGFTEIALADSQAILAAIPGLDAISSNKAGDKVLQLYIEGIEPPADQNIHLRVFINCNEVKADLPVEDPRAVGFIYFFGIDHAGHGGHDNHGNGTLQYVFDITRNAQELYARGAYTNNQITVQILAIPMNGSQVQEVKARSVRVEIQSRIN